jgi:hypothetical protein
VNKNYIIHGESYLAKNDVNQGVGEEANSTGMPPNQKVSK